MGLRRKALHLFLGRHRVVDVKEISKSAESQVEFLHFTFARSVAFLHVPGTGSAALAARLTSTAIWRRCQTCTWPHKLAGLAHNVGKAGRTGDRCPTSSFGTFSDHDQAKACRKCSDSSQAGVVAKAAWRQWRTLSTARAAYRI